MMDYGKPCEVNEYPGMSAVEELRQQIKDWLAKEHALTPDNIEAISLLWSAYDHLKINSNSETKNNVLLTLNDLKNMNGEPVWIADDNCFGIVKVDSKGRWAEIPFVVGHYKGTNFELNAKERNLKLYRHKPKEES